MSNGNPTAVRPRLTPRRLLTGFLLAMGLTLGGTAQAVTITNVASFGSNPGALKMYKYVPSGLPSASPLVVVLHGCTQTAQAYADQGGWHKFADAYKFALVFAEQQSGNNSNKCFNWFEPGDITRGQGEALSIKQMVDKMKTDHAVDAQRVFVTGLSAGGYMVNVMLATYPDVFKGGAPIAGGPYKCATSMTAAFSCMSPGVDKTPTAWGDLARGGYSGYTGRKPVVSIWQGTSDTTVKPMNAVETMQQWTNYHGADQTADVSNTVKGQAHKVYNNGGGTPVVETYDISGMAHGTPLDPGTAADQCGTAGAYMLDVNICSSYFIAKFWGLDGTTGGGGGSGDTVAPTASVTAPSAGASVTGTVTITASASDNVGVTNVEFYVDGNLKGSDASAPYAFAWNTAGIGNGNHTITVKAYDAGGNVGTSAGVTVNVTGSYTCTQTTSSNYTHVQQGRATTSGGYVYAKGSNQNMGLYNTFTTKTLAQTSPGYYVIGNCP